jgi:hypothetical protein
MVIRRSALNHFTRDLRKEIAQFARKLAKEHGGLFTSDPNLRKRAGQFLTALLPPKPRRRGRPGLPSVTTAIRLLRKFKRDKPKERAAKLWEKIYPQAIPGYGCMTELEQSDARQQLRERVRWRLRVRKRAAHRPDCSPAHESSGHPAVDPKPDLGDRQKDRNEVFRWYQFDSRGGTERLGSHPQPPDTCARKLSRLHPDLPWESLSVEKLDITRAGMLAVGAMPKNPSSRFIQLVGKIGFHILRLPVTAS